MYLSSRRGVKRAGIVGAGGPPALSRLVAENSIVVDDARAFPDQAVTSLINQCTSNEVGHFSFRRFSHVSGMSVPPSEDMQCR